MRPAPTIVHKQRSRSPDVPKSPGWLWPNIELTAVHRSSVVQDESIVSINPLGL